MVPPLSVDTVEYRLIGQRWMPPLSTEEFVDTKESLLVVTEPLDILGRVHLTEGLEAR